MISLKQIKNARRDNQYEHNIQIIKEFLFEFVDFDNLRF